MGTLHNMRLRYNVTENYTPIYNDVITKRQSDLSINARMLLIICLSYKDGWEINWNRFEKEEGMSTPARRNALKELAERGYYYEEKYKDGYSWKYTYYFFGFPVSQEDFLELKGKNFAEFRSHNLDDKILTSKSYCQDLDDKIDACINNNINNNNILNNTIENNMLLAETSFRMNLSPNSSDEFDSCNHDDFCNHDDSCVHASCEHDSLNGSTFRKNLTKHDSHGVGGGGDNGRKRSNRTVKGVTKDGKPTKNKQTLNMEQPKVSVDALLNPDATAIILEEQTEEEKRANQAQKKFNDIQAGLKELEQKQTAVFVKEKNRKTWETKINEKIDIDYQDDEKIREKFKRFVTGLKEKGIKTTYTNYSEFKEQLDAYKTQDEMLEALGIGIRYGTPTLSFNINKKGTDNKTANNEKNEDGFRREGKGWYIDDDGSLKLKEDN